VHPALSVIVFTTFSGAGYGLLSWLGIYGAAGLLPTDRIFSAVAMVLALGAVTVGLLSSTLHLGHPERAWRAFSQWRSSWLSREGIASVVTYGPALAFGAGWVLLGTTAGVWGVLGLASAVCAVITVVCTAYIYRSLKPIPRWHNGWVVPNYLALSAMTGALLLTMLTDVFGHRLAGTRVVALAAIAVALVCKIGYWRYIDHAPAIATPESATGLGALGKVRLFEAPHTSDNYLLKEMGFRIARKHARKLRAIAIVLAFALPFVLTIAAYVTTDVLAAACSLAAAVTSLVGVLTERWLFFAEAKHTVTLYYGRSLSASA
jgi:DMSO reductase anchor subunit